MWSKIGAGYLPVVQTGLQTLCIIAAGRLAASRGVFDPAPVCRILNRFVVVACLPALQFWLLAIKTDMRNMEHWRAVGAFMLWTLLVQMGCTAWVILFEGGKLSRICVHSLVLAANNTGILAPVVLEAAVHPTAAAVGMLATIVLYFQQLPTAMVLFELDRISGAAAAAAEWSGGVRKGSDDGSAREFGGGAGVSAVAAEESKEGFDGQKPSPDIFSVDAGQWELVAAVTAPAGMTVRLSEGGETRQLDGMFLSTATASASRTRDGAPAQAADGAGAGGGLTGGSCVANNGSAFGTSPSVSRTLWDGASASTQTDSFIQSDSRGASINAGGVAGLFGRAPARLRVSGGGGGGPPWSTPGSRSPQSDIASRSDAHGVAALASPFRHPAHHRHHRLKAGNSSHHRPNMQTAPSAPSPLSGVVAEARLWVPPTLAISALHCQQTPHPHHSHQSLFASPHHPSLPIPFLTPASTPPSATALAPVAPPPEPSLRHAAQLVLSNALMWTTGAATAVSMLGLHALLDPDVPSHIPALGFVEGTLSWLARCSVPVSLFAMGLFTASRPSCGVTSPAAALNLVSYMGLKLLVLPWLMVFVNSLLGLDGRLGRALVVLTCVPVGQNAFLVTEQYGEGAEAVTGVMQVGLLLMLPHVAVVMAVLRWMGLYEETVA